MALFGRNPTPSLYYNVFVRDEAGKTIDRANLPSLPPIGYEWVADGVAYEIVGGSVDKAQMNGQTLINVAVATVVVRRK